MAIVFGFDGSGGFTAGDTVTGRTSYAYPTSFHATTAKRSAVRTAMQMMEDENALGDWRDAPEYRAKDARHWEVLPARMDDTNSLEG